MNASQSSASVSQHLLRCDDSHTGETPRVLPNISPAANSDIYPRSPWSGKLLLTLDGGGIRGYSSLLIVRRLLSIVADLEKERKDGLNILPEQSWRRCISGADYPWLNIPPDVTQHSSSNVTHASSEDQRLQVPTEEGQVSTGAQRPSDSSEDAIDVQHRSDLQALPKIQQPYQGSQGTVPQENGNPKSLESLAESEDLSRFRAHHYFDYIAGTSTGGLSALMLSRMQMDVNDALNQYTKIGNQVFAHARLIHGSGLLRPKFSAKRMEQALKAVISHGSQKEIERMNSNFQWAEIKLQNENPDACRTAVTAWGGPPISRTHLLRSYDHPPCMVQSSVDGPPINVGNASVAKVWKIARATSAALTHFSKQKVDGVIYTDGGLFCNNPTQEMIREMRRIYGQVPHIVVSIGTGLKEKKLPTSGELINARKRMFFDHSRSLISHRKSIKEGITDSEMLHKSADEILSANRGKEGKYPKYFRFDVPEIGTSVEMDEWEPSNKDDANNGQQTLGRISKATDEYLKTPGVAGQLKQCAEELVRIRRERAATERWEKFATQTVYVCHMPECKWSSHSRADMRHHASARHNIVSLSARSLSQSEGAYICAIDECTERPTSFTFRTQDSQKELDALRNLIAHLEGPPHRMEKPDIKSPHELEQWLDCCRKTLDAAFLGDSKSEARKHNGAVNDLPKTGASQFFST